MIERPEQKNGKYDLFEGTILIVRNPNSGLVSTLVSTKTIKVNEEMKDESSDYNNMLTSVLNLNSDRDGSFKVKEVDFCLNPYGIGQTGTLRRDIRLEKNARNASGVEIIDLVNDTSINKCA